MNKFFTGVFTALITPFCKNGAVDWTAFEKLIEFQIAGGVDGILFLGTTGESPTISPAEHHKIIAEGVRLVGGRTRVLAGAGSNCTAEAIEYSWEAEAAGVDGILQVNPYYNKPSQAGLFAHFSAIAEAVKTPIILYNIAGRTGVNLETDTILRLIEAHPERIVAVKEASGNLDQVREVIEKTPENFAVLSGNDDQNLEILELGGDGVVSVLSNVFPAEVGRLVREKNVDLQREFSDFIGALFCETNPVPVKTILAEMGFCEEVFRLPLVEMLPENRAKLLAEFKKVQK